MDDETYDYLQPGFDPRTLTVPRLRSILVAHDVQYPATAKKPQLIELFYESVVPKAKSFLDKQARAKRSSMGIVDMPSGNSASFEDDIDLPPPTQTRRSRSPRKASARIKSEELEEPEPAPAPSPTKRRAVRGASRQLSLPPDEDDTEVHRSPRRRTRTSTPQVKVEESDDDFFKRTRDGEGPFSSDNPFQSGSSPLTAPRSISKRRKTAGTESTATPYREKEVRRRTDGYASTEGDRSSRSRKSYEVPVGKYLRQETPEVHDIDAGEEFTPEEQLELELEMASKGQTAVQPRQAQIPKKRSSFKVPFAALGITLLSAYAGWYRQEKIAVGYCGLGRPATQIIRPEGPIPDWALHFVEPQCEPCPQHAYCYQDFSVRCEPDFVLKSHPLSVGGLIPLPPTCEPDGEKVRRVKVVADKVVEELRVRRAQFECGELVDETDRNDDGPAITEEQLRKTVSDKRSKRMSEQEFDELWLAAIGDVKEREEVEVVETADSSGVPITHLSSTSLARLSIGCAAKRSFRLGLERYRFPAGFLVVLVALYFYARSRYRSYKAEVAQVPALADVVLSRLAAQKELGEEEIDEPWLFLPNLRDDVLRSVHSLGDRDRIWKRVRAVVEQNSNVRTSQREGRNGEVGLSWEWIGPIGGEAARRRRSGRHSFGMDVKSEDTPEMTEKTDTAAVRSRWQESRPMY